MLTHYVRKVKVYVSVSVISSAYCICYEFLKLNDHSADDAPLDPRITGIAK